MKKKFYPKKRKPMSMMEMSFNMVGISKYKPVGKYVKRARTALQCGWSVEDAVESSGLSLRRVKTLKSIFGKRVYRPRMHGKSFAQRYLTGRIIIQRDINTPPTSIKVEPNFKPEFEFDNCKVYHDELVRELTTNLNRKISAAFGVPSHLLGREKINHTERDVQLVNQAMFNYNIMVHPNPAILISGDV